MKTKEPIDNIRCPVCNRPYSFTRARGTLQDPKREICLECGRIQELSQRKSPQQEASTLKLL